VGPSGAVLQTAFRSVIIDTDAKTRIPVHWSFKMNLHSDLARFVLLSITGMALMATLESSARAAKPEKLLRHVVLFKFKSTATPDDVKKIVQAFGELPKKISEIHSFEWGTDVSPEGKSQGFTHCFLVTFKTEKDRDIYLPHAAHKEFVGIVRPHLDGVLVVDYWTQP
jgi:hypothetical protein